MTYARFVIKLYTTIIPTVSLIVNLVSPWWLQWIIGPVWLSVCVFMSSHDNDNKCSNAKSQPQWNVWYSNSETFSVMHILNKSAIETAQS